jgi:MoxR-like ATPase
MDETTRTAAENLRQVTAAASRGLVERAALVETIALAMVAREHVLIIGPPGTAKSAAARRIARGSGGHYFEYLLGRFTEPSEIFGPVDLRRLRDGIVATETAGMLPEADIAFLDEIFQGSTAILNTLLGILNERVFRRGHTNVKCPLRVCVAASNALPDDESLAAFADRFLLRVFVEPITDPRLEELLEGGWSLGNESGISTSPDHEGASLADVDVLSRAARTVDMTKVRPHLAGALRRLRAAGVVLSDRRAVKVQTLIAAAAVMDERTTPDESDLWPLILAVATPEQQAIARETLQDVLAATRNRSVPTAAEDASQGPLARAHRLVSSAEELLEFGSRGDEAAYRLKLEGVAREIDAGFTPEHLPPDLRTVRERLVSALQNETVVSA